MMNLMMTIISIIIIIVVVIIVTVKMLAQRKISVMLHLKETCVQSMSQNTATNL